MICSLPIMVEVVEHLNPGRNRQHSYRRFRVSKFDQTPPSERA